MRQGRRAKIGWNFIDEFHARNSPGCFSTAQAARLSGLTPRQLDYWARRGFLRPSLQEASGYGSSRRYSFTDIVKLRVAARLRASGIGLARVRRCVEALERFDPQGEADLGRARLIVMGNRVLWARSDEEVVDLLKGGQLSLVLFSRQCRERSRRGRRPLRAGRGARRRPDARGRAKPEAAILRQSRLPGREGRNGAWSRQRSASE